MARMWPHHEGMNDISNVILLLIKGSFKDLQWKYKYIKHEIYYEALYCDEYISILLQGKATHIFSLNYVITDDCLPQMCQLHRASTLPPADQSAMVGNPY